MMSKILDTIQEFSIVMLFFLVIGFVGGLEKDLTTIPECLTYEVITFIALFIDWKIYSYRKAKRNDK